jgi:hypothetical protein
MGFHRPSNLVVHKCESETPNKEHILCRGWIEADSLTSTYNWKDVTCKKCRTKMGLVTVGK